MSLTHSPFREYSIIVPIRLIVTAIGSLMANKKIDVLSASDKQRKAWKKAEKLITQNKAEDALLILREIDQNGSHQTTLRLAGKATHNIAQQSTSKADYRKAASLLRDSVKMNPKDKKSSKAHNDLLNEMQDLRIRHRSLRKVGYAISAIATLLLIVGTIGVSLDSPPREAPASPPSFTQGTVFFGPEPLRGNPVPLLLSAEATVKWDRSDIFLVIADADKKEECDSIPPIERVMSTSQTCKAEDSEYEIVGENGTTGLTWAPEKGEYYVGIGTLGESNPDGDKFTLGISIELNLSTSGYVLTLLFGAFGVRLIKND